jgi:hypothetical protein
MGGWLAANGGGATPGTVASSFNVNIGTDYIAALGNDAAWADGMLSIDEINAGVH